MIHTHLTTLWWRQSCIFLVRLETSIVRNNPTQFSQLQCNNWLVVPSHDWVSVSPTLFSSLFHFHLYIFVLRAENLLGSTNQWFLFPVWLCYFNMLLKTLESVCVQVCWYRKPNLKSTLQNLCLPFHLRRQQSATFGSWKKDGENPTSGLSCNPYGEQRREKHEETHCL